MEGRQEKPNHFFQLDHYHREKRFKKKYSHLPQKFGRKKKIWENYRKKWQEKRKMEILESFYECQLKKRSQNCHKMEHLEIICESRMEMPLLVVFTHHRHQEEKNRKKIERRDRVMPVSTSLPQITVQENMTGSVEEELLDDGQEIKETTPMLTVHVNGRRSRRMENGWKGQTGGITSFDNGYGRSSSRDGRRSPYWNGDRSRTPTPTPITPTTPIANGHNGMNGHANGDAKHYVDNSRKETVHTYDFGDDPMPPDTCCCGKFFILRGCRFVAIISLISVLANTVLYAFGFTRFGVSAWIEIGVLVLEFLTIFMLFCGLARKRSGFLKPYLFFNTIWAICLCILFIMCLWQLIRGGNLSANLWRNLKALKSQSDQERIRDVYRKKEDINAALLGMATATAMTALASLIVVDFLFVQIVYRTFHYLAYKEDKAKEDNVGSQNC